MLTNFYEIQHVEFIFPAPSTDSPTMTASTPIKVIGFTPKFKSKASTFSSRPSPHFPKSLKALPTTSQNLLSVYSVAHNIKDQLEIPVEGTSNPINSRVLHVPFVPKTANVSAVHEKNKTFLDSSKSVVWTPTSTIPINFSTHKEWTEERWTRHVKKIPPSPDKQLDQLEPVIEEIEWMSWLNQHGYRKYYSHPSWVKDNARKVKKKQPVFPRTWVSMMMHNKKKG